MSLKGMFKHFVSDH